MNERRGYFSNFAELGFLLVTSRKHLATEATGCE